MDRKHLASDEVHAKATFSDTAGLISAILKKKKQPEVTPAQDTITQEKLRTM